MKREFIHLPIFDKVWDRMKLDDDQLQLLQTEILERPTHAKVIPSSNGIRKTRWGKKGSGKRGGFRVLYLDLPEAGLTYLLYAYPKSKKGDLTQGEIKAMAEVARKIKEKHDG